MGASDPGFEVIVIPGIGDPSGRQSILAPQCGKATFGTVPLRFQGC